MRQTLPLRDPNRLSIHKFANAQGSQLPPVPRLLHSSKRNPRIGSDHLVDKHHPRFQFIDKTLALVRSAEGGDVPIRNAGALRYAVPPELWESGLDVDEWVEEAFSRQSA